MSERSLLGASTLSRVVDWIGQPVAVVVVLALVAWLQAVKHDVYRDVFWEETSQIHYHGRFVQTIIVQNESPKKVAKILVSFDLDAPKGCQSLDIARVDDWKDPSVPADVLVDADGMVNFFPCEDRGNSVVSVHAEAPDGLACGSSFRITVLGMTDGAGSIRRDTIKVACADGDDIVHRDKRSYLARAKSSTAIWMLATFVVALISIFITFRRQSRYAALIKRAESDLEGVTEQARREKEEVAKRTESELERVTEQARREKEEVAKRAEQDKQEALEASKENAKRLLKRVEELDLARAVGQDFGTLVAALPPPTATDDGAAAHPEDSSD